MKKIISVVLSIIMLFLLAVPAFAGNESNKPLCKPMTTDYNGDPLVIIRGIDFTGLRYDYGTENEKPIINFQPSDITKVLFKIALGTFMVGDKDALADEVIDYCWDLLGGYACDNDGNSVNNVGKVMYTSNVSDYSNLLYCGGNGNEEGIMMTSIEKLGAKNTYYFDYDWRLDPFENVVVLNEMIKNAKAQTGKDKVNIACCSMGGAIAMTYFYEYGYSDINNCVFLSAAFNGTYVSSDCLNGRVSIPADGLASFCKELVKNENTATRFLVEAADTFGIFKFVANLGNNFIKQNKEKVYNEFLIDCFATCPGFWAVCSEEDFDSAVEYVFGDCAEEYPVLLSKISNIRNVVFSQEEILADAKANGVNVSVVANYDKPLTPVYDRSVAQGDGTLETACISGGATCANYHETLSDEYLANADMNYVSPDRVIDASTCIFKDNTWFIKGAQHVAGIHGSDYSDFIFWLVTYDGQPTVTSNAKYPQFMLSSDNQDLRLFN